MVISFPDAVGLVGVIITLAAYFLLSIHKISARSMLYPGLNALGSLLILFSLYYHWNLSAFIMEICWALVSFYGMFATWRITRKSAVVHD